MSAMTGKLASSLRQAPATVPALAALALFVAWASDQAGYPVTHWAPGAIVVLALLATAVAFVGVRVAEIPVPVRIALACLAAYTALSFLSILWADVPGDAWEGADRTLLYLVVFALFACWPQQGRTAALLLIAWTLALVGLAAFVLVHIDGAAGSAARVRALFPAERLIYPTGYANANAALWLMAFWPALLLARSARLPWALRGVLAGGAVLLADVALLSESRGALYATPVVLILVFALLPGRVRTFVLLVPVAAGIAGAAPAVVHVASHLESGQHVEAALHSAIAAAAWSALATTLVVAAGAALERRTTLSALAARRLHRALAAVAVATLLGVLAGGLAASGDPVARVRHAWDTFKSEKGYGADSGGNRLTSGLGSPRYDFYRVALDEFLAHPLVGIGVDNFQQQYLRHGRTEETPRYPHSVEIRTVAETGLVGALLAVIGLGAALAACGRAVWSRRMSDPLAPAVAAAALTAFAYWLVHGSVDWFWEFAGLGGPAFALLGLTCALAPRPPAGARAGGGRAEGGARQAARLDAAGGAERSRSFLRRRPWSLWLGRGAAGICILAAAASLAGPWLSQLEVQSAARIWTAAPLSAYARLDEAARLDPLSDEPFLVAGGIAERFGELTRADRAFASALARSPQDAYATLERGAIASERGQRRAALTLLERAAHLNPRNATTAAALALARRGRRVSVARLNDEILREAQRL